MHFSEAVVVQVEVQKCDQNPTNYHQYHKG